MFLVARLQYILQLLIYCDIYIKYLYTGITVIEDDLVNPPKYIRWEYYE